MIFVVRRNAFIPHSGLPKLRKCLLSKDSQISDCEDFEDLTEIREEVIKKNKKFSNARKDFQQAAREKMEPSVADEEDPALIFKSFWSHPKARSKSTRILESFRCHNRHRNVPYEYDKAELLYYFFKDQFSEASAYDIDMTDFSNDHFNDIEFNYCRIYKLLQKINSNKAADPDGTYGKVLKSCAWSPSYPLSLFFGLSRNTSHIPAQWKMANIVPAVHKKGAKDSVENYHPISLTGLVMKI